MARHLQPQQLWESLCSELNYTAELKSAGADLLQRLQSQDKLGEGTQVRAPQRLPEPSARPLPSRGNSWLPAPLFSNIFKDSIEGIDPGAPKNPKIGKKFLITTIITSLIFIVIYYLVNNDLINLREFLK